MPDKQNTIKSIIAAMDLLADNDQRMEHLFQVAYAGKSGLDWEWFLVLLQLSAEKFFDGSYAELAKSLQRRWELRARLPMMCGLSELGHAMLHLLKKALDQDENHLNDTILSLFYDRVVFFTNLAINTSNYATCQALLNTFGKMCEQADCSEDIISRIKNDESFERVHKVRDGIALGIVEARGAWEILRNYQPESQPAS